MRLAHLLATPVLLGLLSPAARADFSRTTCVRNNVDLSVAMFHASTDPENSIEDIRIAKGVYSVPGLSLTTSGSANDKQITISGGWSVNQGGECVNQELDPENTVINGSGLSFVFFGADETFEISGLTFSNFHTFSLEREQQLDLPLWEKVTTRKMSISHSILRGAVVRMITYYSQEALFSNNLVTGTESADFYAHSFNGERLTLAFNTFASNSCNSDSSGAVWVYMEKGKLTLSHNIFSSNCIVDLYLSDPQELYHNLYGAKSGAAPITNVQPVVTTDPGFVDADAGNFRLREGAPKSEAINVGMAQAEANLQSLFFPPTDLAGGPRVVGSRVDLGAFESGIDDTAIQWVTSNADSGPNTLRAAILSANATPGPATIKFDFGSGPASCGTNSTIKLATPLPPIDDDLVIDGYSADLATRNTAEVGFNASICVILEDAAAVSTGLAVAGGAANADVTLNVSGLQFNGFSFAALSLGGGQGHVVEGNAFGGLGALSNGRGVLVGPGVSGVFVGGSQPRQRNWIRRSTIAGVQLQGGGTWLVNNLIGPDQNGLGTDFFPNVRGVSVDSNGNSILSNTISGNLSDAINVTGQQNKIGSNLIGFDDGAFCSPAPCASLQGNLRGIGLAASNNTVEYNRIGGSTKQGIAVFDGTGGNKLFRNRFVGNGGLAIDLGGDELADDPQVDDSFEMANAANGGQNFPTLTSASGAGTTGTVAGTLSSRKGFAYAIEVFASATCDPSGHGEGERVIGSTQVTTSVANGTASFTLPVSSPESLLGQKITAIARRVSTGDTSEMSACINFTQTNTAPVIENQTFVLPADSPAGTQLTVVAFDDGLPAPGTLVYSIPSGSPAFDISPDGVLTQIVENPFGDLPELSFDVKVDDSAKSDIATIKIVRPEIFRDGFE